MPETPTLSIIIPAYNEAARIGPSLEQIISYFGQRELTAEVIIVDDGSTDGTFQLVDSFIKHHLRGPVRFKLVSNRRNMGKGFSIKRGVLRASGSIVVFSDSDLSAPITELPKLIDPIRRGECEIVIGSRAIDRRLIGQRQPPWRDQAGRLFNLLMRVIIGLPFKDTQCGFKAYRRDVIVPIFKQQRLQGFSFDVEVLYLAAKRGLRSKEVPVVWNHAEGSRVHMLRDSARMFFDLLRIRWYALTGKYSQGVDPLPMSSG